MKHFRPFREARRFVHTLKLRGHADWLACKTHLPDDIPSVPKAKYAGKGWKSYNDWFGNDWWLLNRRFRPFIEARRFVRTLKLKNQLEWIAYTKNMRPDDIPCAPDVIYANKGWKSLGDWLGNGNISTRNRHYRPFPEARRFARTLKLNTMAEWRAFARSAQCPADIPLSPDNIYAGKGWKGFADWLEEGRIGGQRQAYRPFKDARRFSRQLKLKSYAEWRAFCRGKMPSKGRRPKDIPADADRIYADKGWQNFGDWLGTGNIWTRDRHFRQFDEARTYVRTLGLKNDEEWRAFSKTSRPADIPAEPRVIYAGKGWKGLDDWLGR